MEKQVITCPKCGTEIDVNAVLYQNINKELEQKYIEKNNLSQKEYEQKLADLKKSEESLKKQSQELDEKINAGVGVCSECEDMVEKWDSGVRENNNRPIISCYIKEGTI